MDNNNQNNSNNNNNESKKESNDGPTFPNISVPKLPDLTNIVDNIGDNISEDLEEIQKGIIETGNNIKNEIIKTVNIKENKKTSEPKADKTQEISDEEDKTPENKKALGMGIDDKKEKDDEGEDDEEGNEEDDEEDEMDDEEDEMDDEEDEMDDEEYEVDNEEDEMDDAEDDVDDEEGKLGMGEEEDEEDEKEKDEKEEDEKEKDEKEEDEKKVKQDEKVKSLVLSSMDDTDTDDSDVSDDEDYLQKFDSEIKKDYIVNFHPEAVIHNYDEIVALTKVSRDKNGFILDSLHKTNPILSRFERTKILGQRAKQLNQGSKPLIKIDDNIIDGALIAEMELKEKKIPFIIRRPLPTGASEYWNIKDLEIV